MARAGWNLTFSFRDTEPVSKLILVKFPSGVGITRWGNSNLCSSSLKPILFQSKVGSWRSKLIIHDLYLTFNLQVLIVRSLRSRKLTSCVFKRANYQNMKLFHFIETKNSKCVPTHQNVSILFLDLQLWINGNIYQIYVIFAALLILARAQRQASLHRTEFLHILAAFSRWHGSQKECRCV